MSLYDIEEKHLLGLIAAKTPEMKIIEYKSELPKFDDRDEKKEFLADVSSFANASGGDLIYGIIAKDGVPQHLKGLEIEEPVERKLMQLESIIRSNIEPKIPGLSLREIQINGDRYVIVIRVPRSWASPHMITLERKGDARFFSRFSKGKFDLDVSEIRTAFVLSETRVEQIKNFRIDRIGKIRSEDTSVLLNKNPKVIIHIVPITAFDPTRTLLDASILEKNRVEFQQIIPGSNGARANFDGYITCDNLTGLCGSYVQVFRDGIIESVDAKLIKPESKAVDGHLGFSGQRLDCHIYNSIRRYISAEKKLAIEPPFLIMLSLSGVSGYVIFGNGMGYPGIIDRDVLQMPDIMVESFDYNHDEVMKLILDAVWNAAGYLESQSFDEERKWINSYPC